MDEEKQPTEKQKLTHKLDRLMAMGSIINNISEAAALAYGYGFTEIEIELADILMKTIADCRVMIQEITG